MTTKTGGGNPTTPKPMGIAPSIAGKPQGGTVIKAPPPPPPKK